MASKSKSKSKSISRRVIRDPVDWNLRYVERDTPWDSGEPSRELRRVLDERRLAPCRTLELGCGTGTNSIFLARRGFRVTACDLSPLAIEQARARAASLGKGRAKGGARFIAGDALRHTGLGSGYSFVFDRGVYHHLRTFALKGFLRLLERSTRPGSLYLTLAGNANDPNQKEGGPPVVKAEDLCRELGEIFDVVQLREFHFDGVVSKGKSLRPLGWSALLRRKKKRSR